MTSAIRSPETAERSGASLRRVAVIDVGATAIRMAIAEIDAAGGVRVLSAVTQAVQLGKDTFKRGTIDRTTIESCVRTLRSYKRLMAEHQVDRPEQIRAVATSAVREAMNRMAFLDRIYTATGIAVVPIDEAEETRLTYFGIQPLLKLPPIASSAKTLVVEVGGGSTELLVVQGSDILYSHTSRLGSLRLREPLDAFHASRSTVKTILETQMDRMAEQIVAKLPGRAVDQMVGLGGDLRFAAKRLVPEWRQDGVSRLRVADVAKLADEILDLSEDRVVHRFHVPYPDAATLGPALLAYSRMAKACSCSEIMVAGVNMRDGLLLELASRGAWTEEFSNQVIRSVVELGRKYQIDEAHARQVAKLCRILFQSLREDHQLEPRYELLLTVAALLHEVGLYVGAGSYHKHTAYIISNSEIFGLSGADLRLIAQTSRYHRKSVPKPTHLEYSRLTRDERIAVAKMAALLRVADALDAARLQKLHELRFAKEGGRLVISAPQTEDLSLEQIALKQTGTLFESTYGLPVLLRRLSR